MSKRVGRKSAAQTPAPKSDKIYGSKKNKVGSASEGEGIKLSAKTEDTLKQKLIQFKEKYPNKKNITISDLKAVYRRGSGAYSKSHRPTITGGAPNSRAAWSYARVNKFLEKAAGKPVKKAYVQDDDLFAKGGKTKGGDCYLKAGSFCLLPDTYKFIGKPYLVHAEVRGQGKIEGLRYGHAWVEDDENVYDFSNGREIIMPKQLYYYYGDIKTDNPKKYQRYTFPEARAKMLKTKHYGSWDIETEFADGGLIAPNGKLSNLTLEQYELVRTPQFKAWFGDWENDPQNASKVVDENGEPLVVYHGSNKLFNEFDINKSKYGFFFTNSYELALTYDKNVNSFFLNIKKPRKKDFRGANYDGDYQLKDYSIRNIGYDTKTFASISHPNTGYDGAFMKNVMDVGQGGWNENIKPSNIYVVFESNQIKLADGTNTTFDIDNQDIRYSKGGKTFNDKELLSKWKKGESIGFTGEAHLKAKGLIPRADGHKRKSEKYMEDGGEMQFKNGGEFNKESGLKKLAKEKKASITNAFDQIKNGMKADQYRIVRTPEFKNWFGDWEKDPNNCSVVRERNGEPLVVWHGSPSKFNIFKTAENGIFYFAENAGYASHFADGSKNTYPYFLNIRKIFDALKFDIEPNETNLFINEFGINTKWLKKQQKLNNRIKFWELLRHDEDFREYLIKQGYDGVRYVEDNDDSWIEKSIAYGCFNANQIKLANGINTTFSTKSKDIRYENGGETSQEIQCVNCGWKWETSDSDENDMYVCHQCGFDNTLYYTNIMSKLKKPMSVSEISREHGVDEKYIENQLVKGIKHELEHTTDEGIARIIALHHIGEKPNYYELVEKYKLEDGGQPSKFWHKAEKYEISDFIQNERNATKELLCSSDTRISKAIICRAKIDFCEKKERNTSNFEIKNAWSEVKNIWEDCLFEVKNGVVYEFNDGGECGCASKSKEYKDGGLAYGNSHDKGGMPLTVQSTGQNIEIEGGEGVINKRSMQMKKRIDFEGKKLTPCQIVSKINEMGGGVKFKCEDVEEILEKDGSF